MSELIVLTGPRGIGKTTAAGSYARVKDNFERIFYHDTEESANNFVEGLKSSGARLGYYNNLKSRFRDLPNENDLLHMIEQQNFPWVDESGRSSLATYWQYILSDLDTNLKRGDFNIYIHDTLETMEAAMVAYVEGNKRKTGVTGDGWAKLWTAGVYMLYPYFLEAIYGRGVETVILTSHLKTPWENKQPVPGKVVPSGKPILYMLSRLFVWLVNEPSNPNGEPAGIIIKERFGKTTFENNKIKTRRMLPRRMPKFTWDEFDRYLEEGCDLTNPAPGESLSKEEQDMISESYNSKQMELMIANVQLQKLEEQTRAAEFGALALLPAIELPQRPDRSVEIRALLEEGKGIQEIITTLGVTMPEIFAVQT